MKKFQGKALALVIFESAMAVFYFLLGLWLAFAAGASVLIENRVLRIVIGVLFLIYGVFRIYRAIRKLFIED